MVAVLVPMAFVTVTVYALSGNELVGAPDITHVEPFIESPLGKEGEMVHADIAEPRLLRTLVSVQSHFLRRA